MDQLDNQLRSFAELANPVVPTIQESDFVKYFLPLFMNFEDVPVAKWLQISGHPFNAVNVLKGTEVLYTVPPLCKQFNVGVNPGESVLDTIVLAQKKEQLSPALGANYLNGRLQEIVKPTNLSLDTIHQWNNIFKRYGLPEIELPKVVETNTQTKPSVGEVVDFEEL